MAFITQCRACGEAVSIDHPQHILSPRHNGRDIINETAEQYRVSLSHITGPSQGRSIARIRWRIMYRLRTELGYSLPRIGKLLNRDHTTVLHGLRQYAKMMEAGE